MMLPEVRAILRAVRFASNLHEALATVADRIKNLLPIDASAIYLTDVATDRYVLMASAGLSSTAVSRVHSTCRDGLLGLVFERRELVIVENATAHPRFRPFPGTHEEQFSIFLGVPLIHLHRVLGVLVAWKRDPGEFGKHEQTFFVTLAAQLAGAVHDAASVDEVTRLLRREPEERDYIQGIQAAPGIAIGTGVLLPTQISMRTPPVRYTQDADSEEASFRDAIRSVQREFETSATRMAGILPAEAKELFDVFVMLLDSGGWIDDAVVRIRGGSSASHAWRDSVVHHAQILDGVPDPYLRARADDFREIGQKVLLRLHQDHDSLREYEKPSVLVADSVGITDIAAVPNGHLVGIVCRHGSALAHGAVLARALGIPAVVSLASWPKELVEGCKLVVDGDRGRIYVNPPCSTVEALQRRIDDQQPLSDRLDALRTLPAETTDGVVLPLHANVGLASDAEAAKRCGADGIGLFRTEYSFLLRETFPIEEEQYQTYRALLSEFAPKPVTIRTLDVGGDKILSYFPIAEDNPFLGCRGIRFSLAHPDIFLIQLRALLRANAGLGNLQVVFPMISLVDELDETLELLAHAHRQLLIEGQAVAMPQAGAMIEVPSAVFLAKALAKRAAFISIGTNDLTQYLLAADRTNAEVATPYDTLHPAVLHSIQGVIRDAHSMNKHASVCGEMAGDPAAALALLGMGVDTLSMSSIAMSRVKLTIRSFTAAQARLLADQALSLTDGKAVSALLNAAIERAGIFKSDDSHDQGDRPGPISSLSIR